MPRHQDTQPSVAEGSRGKGQGQIQGLRVGIQTASSRGSRRFSARFSRQQLPDLQATSSALASTCLFRVRDFTGFSPGDPISSATWTRVQAQTCM